VPNAAKPKDQARPKPGRDKRVTKQATQAKASASGRATKQPKAAASGRATKQPKAAASERATKQPKAAASGHPTEQAAATTSAGKPKDQRSAAIAARLSEAIPDARVELHFANAFQLLIATILSAQSTDKMVNSVTPALFARYPDAKSLAAAEQEEIEELVRKTGFYRNKAKLIRGAAQKLVSDFGGEVPKTLEAAVTLPGVARKTANVVLGSAHGIASGFVVDTHVSRVAQRLALTAQTDPIKIENDLCAAFPQSMWIDMSHRLLLHGRYTCVAKKPRCDSCPLRPLCPSAEAA
jgi:endonuclease-3